jgi:23S rRNA pseudouridine1911/1915/1917 synthase
MKKFKIKKDTVGKRLDLFLAEELGNTSRNQIQKMIKDGIFLLNGQKTAVHSFLKAGDIIAETAVDKKIAVESKDLVVDNKGNDLVNVFKKIKIIEDNPEYLVLNKPAGIIIHGGEGIKEKTLVDWLLVKYPKIKKIGDDPLRPGIVHRLDREASGLMVIAKTEDSFTNLKKQFQKRLTAKEYSVLVYGRIARPEGEINFPIKRSTAGYKMAAMPEENKRSPIASNIESAGARRAITFFKVVQRFINYTLLKVKIKTGRTHQIRVHFFAYGHPVAGDDLYSTKKTREMNKKINLGRIFLVADKLAFKDISGNKHEFKIDLPKELKDFLAIAK